MNNNENLSWWSSVAVFVGIGIAIVTNDFFVHSMANVCVMVGVIGCAYSLGYSHAMKRRPMTASEAISSAIPAISNAIAALAIVKCVQNIENKEASKKKKAKK